MEKLSLIFSDIEIGGGDAFDDFVEEDLLCATIKEHFDEAKKYDSEIILNGDILDFLKCTYNGKHPRHITEKVSLHKLERIYKAHPEIFKALRGWLANSSKAKIVFVVGNHDFDLIFPGVQERLKELIAGKREKWKERVIFPGFEYENGVIYAEHGCQLDTFFKVDPKKFISTTPNKYVQEPFLMLPWGYNGIYDHFIHLKKAFPMLERLYPKERILKVLPLNFKKNVMIGGALFLFKSFFYTQFKYWNDPLYRFSTLELFNYASSLFRKQFNLIVETKAKIKVKKRNNSLMFIGHSHDADVHHTKAGKVINTGIWVDEYYYFRKNRAFMPIDKSYGYVLHDEKKVLKLSLIRVPSKQKRITVKEVRAMYKKHQDKIDLFFGLQSSKV
jgi:UDP-2,3-diacylglucosamine pyrophosphatase LpxH